MEERYLSIVRGLGTHFAIEPYLRVVHAAILADPEPDYAASRGEYLNGLILANLLGYDFVDPAEGIVFQQDGHLDEEATQKKLSELLAKHPRAVVPGFYGALPDGHIKTFSRGGSDITGAIVARAVGAELYENWTDDVYKRQFDGDLVLKLVSQGTNIRLVGIQTVSYTHLPGFPQPYTCGQCRSGKPSQPAPDNHLHARRVFLLQTFPFPPHQCIRGILLLFRLGADAV